MKFFKKVFGFLGFGKDDGHDTSTKDDHDDEHHHHHHHHHYDDVHRNRMYVDPIPGPRQGFKVPVQVAVERPAPGPVLLPCHGDGGLQGLRWYAKCLKIDEDGDVADEFVHQVLPDMSSVVQDQPKPLPRFQVKHNVRHAKVQNQIMTLDGKLIQCVEWQGRLQWV